MTATLVAEAQIRCTGAALGAEVLGLNLQSPAAADIATIVAALRDNLVIRLRSYVLDDAAFTRLAERFGDLEGSPEYSRSYISRANSRPIAVVRKEISLGKSAGSPALRTACATPRRRKISMLRAETWLHLGLGGSSRALASATMTEIPRQARSIARVMPTGPAPMITTAAWWCRISGRSRLPALAARRAPLPPRA